MTTRPHLSLRATRALRVPQRWRAEDWLPKNVVMPAGTETAGQPFNLQDFPHVGGVLEAFYNPAVRTISLQWASRLGKTTACLALMAFVAATNPRNMMLASPNRGAAARVVTSRLYPILESTDGIRYEVQNPAHRSATQVALKRCLIYCGWSGSESSLADVGAYFGVANEIDKWDGTGKAEGDPLRLFINRFKGFPDHKIIFESTPTLAGKSRIENRMSLSNQHRRWCPCPFCGEYQVLQAGKEGEPGGIKWERLHDGTSDPDIAFQTAHYECAHCLGKILNRHRPALLRAGLWVPEGCSVEKGGRIIGKARRAGSEHVGFGPLASWYALTETWGHFARLWVETRNRPKDRQDVVNSYMGETYASRKKRRAWTEVAARLATSIPRGIVPRDCTYITLTIDRQKEEGGYVIWAVVAHSKTEHAHLVDYGRFATLEQCWRGPASWTYQHEDGGEPLRVVSCGVDSGWDSKATYDFCRAHEGVLPIKGANTDLRGLPFVLSKLGEDSAGGEGLFLFNVGTDFWETDLQARLETREPGDHGTLTLCQGAEKDAEFMQQLCNSELSDTKTDKRGESIALWVKRDSHYPNDFRDVIRYGLALGLATAEEIGIPERASNGGQ